MKFVDGGVCAAKGFKANGWACGIKYKDKKDIALIVSENMANAAAVFTKNLVKGAPLIVSQENLANGKAKAIICNSGNANTCNANGQEIAENMCKLVAKYMDIAQDDVIVASTGVIGQPLFIEPIAAGMPQLVAGLGSYSGDAAEAIMTTDLMKKEVAISFELHGITCHIGGIAKGSGMIHPNMATMLAFITTDVAISSEMLQKALKESTDTSYNMISVDGDTSTNDMACILANGLAGNKAIEAEGEDYHTFVAALNAVNQYLCKKIAQDGEGASKLIECQVTGAKDTESAQKVAKAIICSSLVKTAIFGEDANWGRILCAIGYSGAELAVDKVDVSIASDNGKINVCQKGTGIEFSEDLAKEVLGDNEIIIAVELNTGQGEAIAWGCDLTYDYVKINGDYRS